MHLRPCKCCMSSPAGDSLGKGENFLLEICVEPRSGMDLLYSARQSSDAPLRINSGKRRDQVDRHDRDLETLVTCSLTQLLLRTVGFKTRNMSLSFLASRCIPRMTPAVRPFTTSSALLSGHNKVGLLHIVLRTSLTRACLASGQKSRDRRPLRMLRRVRCTERP